MLIHLHLCLHCSKAVILLYTLNFFVFPPATTDERK